MTERARRRRLFRVLTPLLLALGLAVGFELALRAYHARKAERAQAALPPLAERAVVPSDDPRLIYELNPGWSKDGFTVNRHGMPDRARSRQTAPGTLRVAVVGDSISCNLGLVPRAEGWVAQLEEALGRECLNFGVNGYGIEQTARAAERAVERFAPDVVIAQLCLNDPYPSDGEYVQALPRRRWRTLAFLQRRLQPARFWADELVARAWDARGRAQVAAGLASLARLQGERRRVLAVLFPYLQARAYAAWGFQRYHDALAGAAKAAGVPLLDLRPAFAEAGLIVDRWPLDPLHPTPEGHALAARAVAAELKRRGWVP